MGTIPDELQRLADACGVLTSYDDVYQQRRYASVESILAVLGALDVNVRSLDDVPRVLAAQQLARLEQGIEPVIVCWDGEPTEFDLILPVRQRGAQVSCAVELEDHSQSLTQKCDLTTVNAGVSECRRFASFRLTLPNLDWGYHRLRIDGADIDLQALIIAAPRRAFGGAWDDSERNGPWGCFSPSNKAWSSGSQDDSGRNGASGCFSPSNKARSSSSQDDSGRNGAWGCFLPLYALRSERNWGAGDFTDLQNLSKWTAGLGGNVVGTLPLLAAYLDEPYEPSPYAPVSRLAWNEFYIDVTRIAELSLCPAAARSIESPALRTEVAQLRQSDEVDYRRIMAQKRRVLQVLADSFFESKPAPRYADFEQFLRQHPHVVDYAAFRATQERRAEPWRDWPQPLQGGELSSDDYDPRCQQYHLYAQWIATQQLELLTQTASGGLYLDLPLGVRADGYDVWRWPEAYANNASAGSPPDAVWTKGQDWGFPPLHPAGIRRQGYRHVRDFLSHHMRLARLLRIDHVMQLHRLYWIPHGLPADQGCYVKYPAEEFYAILNLESHRCRAMLIGENLGTVPAEVNQAMERHNMQQMYVVQYEVAACENQSSGASTTPVAKAAPQAAAACASALPSTTRSPMRLNPVPAGSLASLNTHDMPSFAAWWRGLDLSLRQELDLLSEQDAIAARRGLEVIRTELTDWLRSEGFLNAPGSETADDRIVLAILKFLSSSPAGVVLVNLEDLWLETRPQNVPGTGAELPNWRRKAALSFEQFTTDPGVAAALQAVAAGRQTLRAKRTADADSQ